MRRLQLANKNQLTHWMVILTVPTLAFFLLGCSQRPVSQKAGSKYVFAEIWASNECPKPGEAVTLRGTATNHGPSVFSVELKDQPVLDISIFYRTSNGDRTIHWSDGKPLTSDLTQLKLHPGESKTIEMQWVTDPQASGVGVSARLIDDPRSLNNPINPLVLLHVNSCAGPFGPRL